MFAWAGIWNNDLSAEKIVLHAMNYELYEMKKE